MRRSVLAAVLASAVIGMVMTGCDLLNKEVLIDDGVKTTVNDSTTIRLMSSVQDSTQLVINTVVPWEAAVAADCNWCTLSKNKGEAGKDTIYVRVKENTTTHARQTFVFVESGNMIMRFTVNQMAGEAWHDTPYWERTAAQRMGLHGLVQNITVTDNRHSTEAAIYSFDSRGNLLEYQSIDKVANRYDTTRTFTYDDKNHRLTCTVTADATGEVTRKWVYEYENTGKYVAVSERGWTDPDPLAEDMAGMIVPDLSAIHKSWIDGVYEYHHDRKYVFDGDNRLLIISKYWVVQGSETIPMGGDTARVSYQYFNNCLRMLPYTSRNNVVNTTYYDNCMVKMLRTTKTSYDFLDNDQAMLVSSFEYTGPQEQPHEIDSYECEYNINHDLLEKRTRYSGDNGVTVLSYPQYQYDAQHNWSARVEELLRPTYTEPLQNATKREILYYR